MLHHTHMYLSEEGEGLPHAWSTVYYFTLREYLFLVKTKRY